MRIVGPTEKHKEFRDELIAVLRRHGSELDASEMLAIVAYLVGQLVAMQDQRRVTSKMVMELVSANIEAGNREAIDSIRQTKGTA